VQPPLGDASWWERHRSRRDAAASCARLVARQIQDQQRLLGLLASQTTVIGFAQGATVALELVRRSTLEEAHEDSGPSTSLCSVVVAYAAQLARPLLAHERVDGSVHLIHGDLDHRVPAIYGHQAYRSLKAAGADVTWDLLADATHTIGQDGVIVGTMRALHSIFRGRSKGRVTTLH
jgi:predicted esterase